MREIIEQILEDSALDLSTVQIMQISEALDDGLREVKGLGTVIAFIENFQELDPGDTIVDHPSRD